MRPHDDDLFAPGSEELEIFPSKDDPPRRRREEPPPEPPAPPEPPEPDAESEAEEEPRPESLDEREPDPGREDEPAPGQERTREKPPLKLKRPRIGFLRSETSRRVLWAIPWIAFAITIVAVGDLLFTVAIAGLGVVGLREYFAMTADARPLQMPAYLAFVGMVLAAHFGTSFQVLLLFAAVFPLMFLAATRRPTLDRVTFSLSVTVLGLAWLGLGFSHVILLRDLPDHGGALVIDVLVATFVGDTCAYAAGRMFGSRKMAPRISPNKTYEGLLGGFLGAVMGFWLAGLYQDWLTGNEALIMGAAVGVAAPIGDLFASMIKRDWGIKDTGKLFGPHGGLIDRIDALLFTVVVGYYLSVALVY